jgi:hypothetical protein
MGDFRWKEARAFRTASGHNLRIIDLSILISATIISWWFSYRWHRFNIGGHVALANYIYATNLLVKTVTNGFSLQKLFTCGGENDE